MRSRRFCSLLIAMLGAAPAVWPQGSNSTVRGSVRDQAQAVIPAATVTLTNTATNVTRTTTTNDSGLYAFPGVIPGLYRIVAEFTGMQRFEGNLTVQVQQDAVVDMALQVGQTNTQVDVQDVTPVVQVDSPALGQVLERRRLEQLPISGRGFQALLLTVPGFFWETHGHGIGGRMQGAGMPGGSDMLVFDGAPLNEVDIGRSVARPPSLDSIEEMRLEVNNSSAKFSRPTTVVLSSRSGANTFHGALFETNRNSAIGVARRRQDYYEKAPYLNRNEYGVSAGGPVRIPKLYNGRDRTFWFWAWEGTRFWTNTTVRASVPTEAMRNGDFRGLVDSQGRQYNLYDPFTTDPRTLQRAPLAHRGVANTIDPARMSPTAKYIFQYTKLPTHPQINPLIDSNWVGPSLRILEQDSYSLRLDHRFSERDLVYGRFSYGTHYEEYSTGGAAATFEPIDGRPVIAMTNRWRPNHNASTTWIHTFSPTMTNELLITGTREYQWRGAGDQKTNYAREMGLPNPLGAINWPGPVDLGLPGFEVGGEAPFYLVYNYLTFQDNATRMVGKHEFQFGFHWRWEDVMRSIVSTAGPYSAATLGTALYDPSSTPVNPIARPLTGHNLANLYLGVMNYSTAFRRPWVKVRRTEYAPYFQDNWKLTPRLTLNLGLRYEFRTPLKDRSDIMTSFDFERKAYVIASDLDTFIRRGATLPSVVQRFQEFGGRIISHKEAGLPEELVFRNYRNFGPRLGFAYRALEGKKSFVLRGGYRLSYFTEPINNWFGSQSSPQITATNFQYTVSNTSLSPDGLPNYGLRTVPAYTAGVNTPDSVISLTDARALGRGFTAVHIDPHTTDPRIHDWNLTLEKEVMNNTALRLTYVGNAARNIQQTQSFNDSVPSYIWYATRQEPLPTGEFASVATRPYDQQVYGTVNGYFQTGYSNYNGIQVELERRYGKGLAYQVFWVLNNTLAAADTIPQMNSYLPGAIPADLEERNRFLNYSRESTWPKHQIRWNWIADLPFGRGKRFGGDARGVTDKLIGGWQIAGTGELRSSYWNLPTNLYPTTNPVEIYGYKYPIEDCTGGVCYPGYLWWNGYIPANRINSRDANGRPNGIMGVPADYKPAAQPLIPWGSTGLPANAPANTNLQSFWDTNDVWIPLKNATVQRVAFNDNLHPWRNQSLAGVMQWDMNASLFKFVNLTERLVMRLNIDFFNVLNRPNNPTGIAANGVLATRNSGVAARVTQLTLRLQW